jgi:hypothetical protein
LRAKGNDEDAPKSPSERSISIGRDAVGNNIVTGDGNKIC